MSTVDPNQLWSRPMLRRLLLKHRVGLGARILVIGFVHGPLAGRLAQFGLNLHELDDNPAHVMEARRDHVDIRIDQWRGGEPLPLSEDDRYDLVLIRDRKDFRQNIVSPRVMQLTADLLSVLTPGGSLVFVDEFNNEGKLLGHSPECLTGMLGEFSGTVTRKRFRRSLLTTQTWWSLLTQGRRGRREMISLTIPDREISRSEWRQQAVRISDSQLNCCQTPAEIRQRPIRKAA